MTTETSASPAEVPTAAAPDDATVPDPSAAPPIRSDPTSGGLTSRRLGSFLIWAALMIVGATASFLRLPVIARNTLWAEDGRFFLQDALNNGALESLFVVYQGYLHLVPRLFTAIALEVAPLERFAVVMTILCCMTVGLVTGAVFLLTRDLPIALVYRMLLASITFLAPASPTEVLGNAANLHWYFLWLTPFLLLYRPRTWPGAAALAAAGIAIGLTEIQAVFFVPVILLALRQRKSLMVAAGLLAGLAAQFVCSALFPRVVPQMERPSVIDIVLGYLANIVLGTYTQSSPEVGALLLEHGWGVGVLAAVPFVAAIAIGVVYAPRSIRAVVLVLAIGSTAAWSADIFLNPDTSYQFASFDSEQLRTLGLLRYAVVPSMLLLASAIVAIGGWSTRWSRSGRSEVLPGLAAGAILMLLIVHTYPSFTQRSAGPSWADSVDAAELVCDTSGVDEPVIIDIAPERWQVTTDCGELLEETAS